MQKIVIIADEPRKSPVIDITQNDLEGNSAEQTNRLKHSLQELGPVICYTSVKEFEKHLDEHKSDIVFPLYYGSAGTSAKGIVPMLCDIHKISYIGGDAYTHLLCNDKSLSKQYASNFGIKSARGCLLRGAEPDPIFCSSLRVLQPPLIVKPNYGGGSTGISSQNIVDTYDDAKSLAKQLYQYLRVPILIEEYISGYEVELIMVGSKSHIRFCEEVQLLMDEKSFFQRDIWGFETKKIDDSSIDFCMSNYISQENLNRLCNLFRSFEKIEIARFDGRVRDGQFYLIELSPDCYLGDDCAFYYAFKDKGYTHSEMFKFLIDNALGQD